MKWVNNEVRIYKEDLIRMLNLPKSTIFEFKPKSIRFKENSKNRILRLKKMKYAIEDRYRTSFRELLISGKHLKAIF